MAELGPFLVPLCQWGPDLPPPGTMGFAFDTQTMLMWTVERHMGDREGKGAMFRSKLSILAPWPGLSLNSSDGCADRPESPPSHTYLSLGVAHPGNQETDTM